MREVYLLEQLKRGDKQAFTDLFQRYYKDLVLFGGEILHDRVACEDIVQSIFLKLWNERENLSIETSLKAFLLRSVRNACIDEIRHGQVKYEHADYVLNHHALFEMDTEHYILYSDLQQHLAEALEKMPKEYREAFEMHRFESLKYKEIAGRLQVSERTVEVRISKAIQFLKGELKDFLFLLLLLGID
ncbi:RNA polymerase sigma-70 factor (family 1) [Parabacteroides sp. PFB2-12]|nr:RNA polymerase sigma-70 factor (family 1) [Parabacteroides sp. PM6-13]MDH6391889.1 RNA polymerase sigma-70 factor (family 1) [Parabacteroides sp. PFB2-12]